MPDKQKYIKYYLIFYFTFLIHSNSYLNKIDRTPNWTEDGRKGLTLFIRK